MHREINNFVRYIYMKRLFSIILLILGCFLLATTGASACTKKAEKGETVCEEKFKLESEKKDCCKAHNRDCGKHGNGCEGQCENPFCNCLPVFSSLTVPVFAHIVQTGFLESKMVFAYSETFYPSKFYSIWLPPKIG